MTKNAYIKRMKQHEQSFDKLWKKIVFDTNEFISDNPDIGMYTMQSTKVEKLIDSLCLSGAWINDRIEGYSGVPSLKGYNKSLTRKIRKALGYIR